MNARGSHGVCGTEEAEMGRRRSCRRSCRPFSGWVGRPPLVMQTLNDAGAEHLDIIGRRWIPS
jgi:hypothetical protein